MAREWNKFSNDELFAIWKSYLKTEYPTYGDPLGVCRVVPKPMRLTPLEIIQLVEDLMDRLEIKENSEIQKG